MFEIKPAGVVRVLGKDADRVVNNMTTNDIKKLDVGQCCQSFVTNVRGWCVELCYVCKLPDEVLLVGQLGNPDGLCRHLEKYIIREDAVVSNLSQQQTLLWLDPFELTTLAQRLSLPVLRTGDVLPVCIDQFQLNLGCTDMLRPGDGLLICQLQQSPSIIAWLGSVGLKTLTSDQFEAARIQAMWPLPGSELLEKSIPQELDRDAESISFTKGCYLGQETIARLDARGQLQRKLCLIKLESKTTVKPATELYRDGQVVGQVTSAVAVDQGQTVALAYLRRGNFEPGTQLTCDAGTGEVIARSH